MKIYFGFTVAGDRSAIETARTSTVAREPASAPSGVEAAPGGTQPGGGSYDRIGTFPC
jgi:hypothetical protein